MKTFLRRIAIGTAALVPLSMGIAGTANAATAPSATMLGVRCNLGVPYASVIAKAGSSTKRFAFYMDGKVANSFMVAAGKSSQVGQPLVDRSQHYISLYVSGSSAKLFGGVYSATCQGPLLPAKLWVTKLTPTACNVYHVGEFKARYSNTGNSYGYLGMFKKGSNDLLTDPRLLAPHSSVTLPTQAPSGGHLQWFHVWRSGQKTGPALLTVTDPVC